MHCPCHSQKPYSSCCQPLHTGAKLAPTALALMRSRYSAYSLHLVSYVIQTTHPDNLLFTKPRQEIEKDLIAFCEKTTFTNLKIIEFIDGPETACVTFKAFLKQAGRDVSFQEKSLFQKVGLRWLYLGQE